MTKSVARKRAEGISDYSLLTNKPSLSTVATTGDYDDLVDLPDLSNLGGGTSNFSGSYNDLTNKPTLFSGVYNDLTSKPSLFSEDYTDLTNKPDLTLKADKTLAEKGISGYELTGGFSDRNTTGSGQSDIGSNVEYTQAMVDDGRWYRFGFNSAKQITNDTPYWSNSSTNSDEAPHSGTTAYQGVGLFSGTYMPEGVSNLFNFTQNDSWNLATTLNGHNVTAGTGSLDFTDCTVGDFAQIRFDFNILPKIANTTIEAGLIWSTRDTSNNVTFTFPLATTPMYFGNGTVGSVFLCRPIATAYFASMEDVNARALLAIRANNPVDIQPLTTLVSIER